MPIHPESRHDRNYTQLHSFLVFRGLGWLFQAAQGIKDHETWLHHVPGQLAPQVKPPPMEIRSWEQTDRQRHQIAVKDIWGAHLRQVEHLTSNGTAPARLLAITKDLYVETMLAFGEGQTSSAGSPSQDACRSGCPSSKVSES